MARLFAPSLLVTSCVVVLGAAPASASAMGPMLAELLFRAPADCEWHLKAVHVDGAEALVRARGRELGEGVVIAFPDTGSTLHPEIVDGMSAPYLGGWDFLDDDDDPRDDLTPAVVYDLPGHAAQALSVLVSRRGPPTLAASDERFVTGIAPAAKVLPLRVGRSVFVTEPELLARSIRFAVDAGAHVVLITRGSALPSATVERAIADAVRSGVIVVAAAGNGVPFVVYPARLPDVIAVAGTDGEGAPWRWSSFGAEVDVAAPGADVYAAYPYRALFSGDVEYAVKPAGGTTIASSLVAGAGAIWLSYHGRDELLARYGPEGLVRLFQRLVRETARRPEGWPAHGYGGGILDVEALLRAPLPELE